MKTAGQILQSARIEKKLDINDVSRITKIRPNFISSIEADDYSRLPNGATARGFIRNYSEFLSLNPEYILAVFRRDFAENQQGQIVPRGMIAPASHVSFWTPKNTIVAVVIFIFIIFGGYLAYQYKVFTGPPPLTLSTPAENSSTVETTIELKGKTDPEATISVNGQLVALEKGGLFSVRVPLVPGQNDIRVVSTGKTGKSTTIIRKIVLTSSP